VKCAAVLLIAATLALGAAGCGGGNGSDRLSKSQYESRLGALGHAFSSGLDFKTTDFKNVPTYFQTLARRFEDVAAQARAIKPPRDVQDLHARIIDGMEKAAKVMGRFAARLRSANVEQVKRLLRQFDSTGLRAALHEVDGAGAALADRGYTINSSAGK
jgi:hypothetical protein